MIIIATYYLVDYENVHSQGLAGCDKTKKRDHIIIFFTSNGNTINMSSICNHGESEIEFREVAPGKQSVDQHIISYMGFIIGKNSTRKNDVSIVIISKDTGFDKVIAYWKAESGFKIKRSAQISGKTVDITSQEQSALITSSQKKEKNNEIIKLLRGVGLPSETVTFVASTVVKNLGVQNGKQQIYRAIIARFKQQKGLEIYRDIKKHL